MERQCFTGRKEHRRGDLVHFADVTVQAEPCLGESEVVLSEEVLGTLREVFGPDFKHQRHCVWSAVSVQLSTINVAGDYPLAGATFFRAEVVGRGAWNAGREVSGFPLSIAAMNAIAGDLTAWEHEQEPRSGGVSSAPDEPEDSDAAAALPPEDDYRCAVHEIPGCPPGTVPSPVLPRTTIGAESTSLTYAAARYAPLTG